MRRLLPLVALLLAVTSCASVRHRLVGDSIATQAEANLAQVSSLHSDVAPGRSLSRPGRRWDLPTSTGLEALSLHAPLVSGWLVIQLGTNDVLGPAWAWDDEVHSALALVPAETCIAWVLPHNAFTPDLASWSRTYSAIVRSALAARSCAAVIDWPSAVARSPWLLSADRIHPTPAGAHMLAALVASAVAAPRGNTVS